MPTLTEIAEETLRNAKLLDAYAASKSLPSPSLNDDTTAELPAELRSVRDALADSAQIMKRIALGPSRSIIEILYSFTDILSLRAIYEYDLAAKVPLQGTISYAELAKASGIPESLCRRFLVHAMENGVFTQEKGEVKHSAISKTLATEDNIMSFVGFVVNDLAPASSKVFEALAKYPDSGESNETGFNIENKTDLPIPSTGYCTNRRILSVKVVSRANRV